MSTHCSPHGFDVGAFAACLISALLISAWVGRPAGAQALYGSVVGNVTDPQGAVVPGRHGHRDEHRHRRQSRDGHRCGRRLHVPQPAARHLRL